MTDKFPSDTTVWQVLRRFEEGAAGSGQTPSSKHNFTKRATPQTSSGEASGAGRLYYEMPTLNAVGRELTTFADLQKTLGRLGFSSGTCLLRLNFSNTGKPLEQAMAEISEYFKEVEAPHPQPEPQKSDTRGAHGGAVGDMQSAPAAEEAPEPGIEGMGSPPGEDSEMVDKPILGGASMTSTEASSSGQGQQQPSNIPPELDLSTDQRSSSSPYQQPEVTIFAPSSSSTPAAAQTYNEADYVPTISHAQQHQARLQQSSRNKKLLSEKELADEARAQEDSLRQVRGVTVRFRFPDSSHAQQMFSQQATASDLYALCRELIDRPQGEDFKLMYSGVKGHQQLAEDGKRLIGDLGWKNNMLVTIIWGDNVSRRGPVLKQQYMAQAQSLPTPAVPVEEVEEQRAPAQASKENQKKEGKSGDKENKLRNMLKLGKK